MSRVLHNVRSISEILKEVLSLEAVEEDASFVENGGDSLSFMIFLSKVERLYGIKNATRHIDRNMSIIDIADILSEPLLTTNDNCTDDKTQVLEDKIFDDETNPFVRQLKITGNKKSYLERLGASAEKWAINSRVLVIDKIVTEKEIGFIIDELKEKHDSFRIKVHQDGRTELYPLSSPFTDLEYGTSKIHSSSIDREAFLNKVVTNSIKKIRLSGTVFLLSSWINTDGSTFIYFTYHHAIFDGISQVILENQIHDLVTSDYKLPAKIQNVPCPSYEKFTTSYVIKMNKLKDSTTDWWKKVGQKTKELPHLELFSQPQHALDCDDWQESDIYICLNSFLDVTGTRFSTKPISKSSLLVATMNKAICNVIKASGYVLDLNHHGRFIDDSGTSFFNTVGWFNENVPVYFEPSEDIMHDCNYIAANADFLHSCGACLNYLKYVSEHDLIDENLRRIKPLITANIMLDYTSKSDRQKKVLLVKPQSLSIKRLHLLALGAVASGNYLRLSIGYPSIAEYRDVANSILADWMRQLNNWSNQTSQSELKLLSENQVKGRDFIGSGSNASS